MSQRRDAWPSAFIARHPEWRPFGTGFRSFLTTRAGKSDGTSDKRPLVGALGHGLYEVRTTFDKNEDRVFFHLERDEVVVLHGSMVLVHSIHKKTRKTPAADLELARRRMKEGT